jgi:hypothetical protein
MRSVKKAALGYEVRGRARKTEHHPGRNEKEFDKRRERGIKVRA